MTEDNPIPPPVFLLAPARSYSTVAVALLAGHPRLFAFPELLVFPVRPVRDLFDEEMTRTGTLRFWGINRISGILRAVAQLHEGRQDDDAIRAARDWVLERGDWTTQELLDHLLGVVAPATGVEKSPDTINSDEAIASCVKAYPDARFLHLTRHPVTSQRSMRKYWASQHAEGDSQSLVVTGAVAWYWGHRRIVRTLESLPARQRLRVRAEDLLSAPQRWLPVILDWLQLDCSTDIIARMRQTERWEFAGLGSGGWLGGGDRRFLTEPRLREVDGPPASVAFEPELGIPPRIETDIRELAEQLGYR
jgi:hypothetical protein